MFSSATVMFSAPSVPLRMETRVSDAEVCQAVRKSSALMPATWAKASRLSPPVATAASIVLTVVENAVPPASASMPMDDIAADQPRMSAWLMPTWVDDAAILWPMLEMALSVVAMWFPRLTMADP